MTDETWREVTEDTSCSPGPKAFFVSGYGTDQLGELKSFMAELGHDDIPLRPCTQGHLAGTLEEALSGEDQEPPLEEGELPYTLIAAGLGFDAVRNIMTNFAKNGLPRPIFATTTPTNLQFRVRDLLLHLLEEQKSAQKMASEKS